MKPEKAFRNSSPARIGGATNKLFSNVFAGAIWKLHRHVFAFYSVNRKNLLFFPPASNRNHNPACILSHITFILVP